MVVLGNLHRAGVEEIPASAGEFVDYRDNARAFEYVAAYDTLGFNLTGNGEPERVEGAMVTASLFPLLGVTAEIGRTFAPAEEQPGRERVAILSHALWTRRFIGSGDRRADGRGGGRAGRCRRDAGVLPFPDGPRRCGSRSFSTLTRSARTIAARMASPSSRV